MPNTPSITAVCPENFSKKSPDFFFMENRVPDKSDFVLEACHG